MEIADSPESFDDGYTFQGEINPDKWVDYLVMVCLKSSVLEDLKFINAVEALAALMQEDLLAIKDYQKQLDAYKQQIKDQYPNFDQARRREFIYALGKLMILTNIVKRRQTVKVMYEVVPMVEPDWIKAMKKALLANDVPGALALIIEKEKVLEANGVYLGEDKDDG